MSVIQIESRSDDGSKGCWCRMFDSITWSVVVFVEMIATARGTDECKTGRFLVQLGLVRAAKNSMPPAVIFEGAATEISQSGMAKVAIKERTPWSNASPVTTFLLCASSTPGRH